MLVYAKNNQPLEAEKLIQEMKDKGLNPNSECYTTLIYAYKKVLNVKKVI